MFSRYSPRTFHCLFKSTVRSSLTRNHSSVCQSVLTPDRYKHSKFNKWLFYVVAGLTSGAVGYYTSNQIKAEDSKSFISQKFGEYENRLREMSAPEKIFEYFASVKTGSGQNKESFMTPADFVRAITPYNYSDNADVGLNGSKFNNDPAVNEALVNILQSVDQNGDGLISFSEFIFFTTLLSIPAKYVKVAFNLFDEDGSGTIDLNEFKSMMRLIRQSSPLARAQRTDAGIIDSAGAYPVFFGEDGTQTLSFNRFETFLKELRDAVLQVQFYMLARSEDRTLSARDYAMNLASYGNLRNMSGYSSRADGLRSHSGRITLDEYRDFNTVLEHFNEIDFALRSFVTMGEPFNKTQLRRAAKSVSGVELSNDVLDVVFTLFDKDGDGKLDYDEFVSVLEGRQSFGFAKPRDFGAVRFTKCLSNCWKTECYRQ